MEAHRMRYMLYIGVRYGTPCSAALSIGVVSARGSEVNQYLKQYNQEYYDGIKPFIKVRFNFKKLFGCEPRNIYSVKLNKNECIIV